MSLWCSRLELARLALFLGLLACLLWLGLDGLVAWFAFICFAVLCLLACFALLCLRSLLYPPKGAANADPEWGSIDFSYVLIILSCVLETYLGVSKCAILSAFLKF